MGIFTVFLVWLNIEECSHIFRVPLVYALSDFFSCYTFIDKIHLSLQLNLSQRFFIFFFRLSSIFFFVVVLPCVLICPIYLNSNETEMTAMIHFANACSDPGCSWGVNPWVPRGGPESSPPSSRSALGEHWSQKWERDSWSRMWEWHILTTRINAHTED